MRRRDLIPILTAAACPVHGQSAGPSGLMTLLESEAAAILKKAEVELASKDSWEPLRSKRRRELQDMLGLDPWPERTPLRVQVRGTMDRDDFTVENIAYESIPHFYATANLYLPKQRTGRVPAVIYVCGHAIVPEGAKTYYQRHGISFARNGYACLIIDPIQISEVFALHHGVFALQLWDWYARGYAPAGLDVWNAIRGIDYLTTRPEIDGSLLAMTGRSGGAAMTWFTAALDERIKAAAPIMGISTYLANIRADTQKGHCDCMFPLNFHRHDMTHQGALIAPRPLLMGHGVKDNLFPVEGYTKFQQMMEKLYGSYGQPERFRNVVVDTGHQDSDYLREEVIRWFDKHLLHKERQPEMTYRNTEAESLRVFAGRPPGDAINPKAHLLFRPAAAVSRAANRQAWEKRKSELLQTLSRRVFHNLAEVETAAPRLKLQNPGKDAVLLYITPDGEEPGVTANFFRLGGGAETVSRAVLQTRDWTDRPRRANEYRDALRNSMHVGLTPETIRLKDVLTAVDGLSGYSRIFVAGRGTDAGVAIYAALLNAKISGLLLMDPPESHIHGPIFLNVMRYTDLVEAASLVAPRRIHFLHRMPEAYRRVRQAYPWVGAAMKEIYSIGEVLGA